MPGKTTVEIEIHSLRACILTLHGDHDAASRPGMVLANAIADGYLNVLMDLSDCTLADSSIDAELLEASEQLRRRDGSLELVVPADAVALRRMLDDRGISHALPFHETRGAGIASIDAAERLGAYPNPQDAGHATRARIDRMQAKTEDRRMAGHPGVIIVRAQVTPVPRT